MLHHAVIFSRRAEEIQVVRIAAVQAAPVLLDRVATLEKARELIRQAARGTAHIRCYPGR